MQHTLSFSVVRSGSASSALQEIDGASPTLILVPRVNRVPLTELVEAYEAEHEWKPPGGYSGLDPATYRYGQFDHHFLGLGMARTESGKTPLLVCKCGIISCWPLWATVRADAKVVVWEAFMQPHRRERDYSGFGPFIFGRQQYERALARLMMQL